MRLVIFLVLFFLCPLSKASQAQILETRVTLNYQQISLAKALAGIKKQYGIGFSYANNLIPLDKKVSVQVSDQSLNEALTTMFKETGITYTVVGQQIVLRKGPEKKKPAVRRTGAASKPTVNRPGNAGPSPVTETSDPLDQNTTASLLPVPTLSPEKEDGSAKTREELENDYLTEKRNLTKNYVSQMEAALETGDTTESVLRKDFNRLKVKLKADFKEFVKEMKDFKDEIREKEAAPTAPKVDSARSPKTYPVQVSFVPPLSTNGIENSHMVNEVSMNVLIGKSAGLNGVEVGGLINMETGNVSGVQVAGFSNLVKGDVEGAEIAGFLNLNKGRLDGGADRRFANLSGSDSSNGLQLAGFTNVHRGDFYGAQVSGFMNVNNGYLIGPQVAGFMNTANGPVLGHRRLVL